jgi:hypothetical protein
MAKVRAKTTHRRGAEDAEKNRKTQDSSSEFWLEPRLLAELVGSDAVKLAMPFDRDHLHSLV